MKLVGRILAAILFVLFFGFALKNADEVTLRLFLDTELHTPLALLLLGFFVAGAILGILALTPTVFRQRRALNKCKNTLDELRKEMDAQPADPSQLSSAVQVANN
jgi:lipopolysaccharide assembly protein A